MLQIVKASAGSGKTTRLSKIYVDMLLRSDDPQEYRHALAVTFTNKATAEMKDKILQTLFKRACDSSDPQSGKAGRILHSILHDYGSFAVSTIDSFFQRTLRAFAHETGQYSSSQVELSKESLIDEAVDSILDGLDEQSGEDSSLLDFITENMEQNVREGRAINIDDALKSMAKELRSEEFWQKSSELNLDVKTEYTPERLKQFRKISHDVAYKYVEALISKASSLVASAASIGLQPTDFSGGKNSWFASYFCKVAQMRPSTIVPEYSDACYANALNRDKWFSRQNADKLDLAWQTLSDGVQDYFDYYQKNNFMYRSAMLTLSSLYGLAIAQRLEDEFEKVTRERNVICLDESNRLLKDIIDGSDAPFVYEKTGTRIGHYLLDEFQDTSTTQWANFYPLLDEAVANDKETSSSNVSNLIVGDVKQSIYRWRESDWSLMESKVGELFPQANHDTLEHNFRSLEQIIQFNSSFYPSIAAQLDLRCGSGNYISKIYDDVVQKVGNEKNRGKGYVQVCFCDDKDAQLNKIVEVVKREINEHHARPCDIAILVRKNDKGSLVASRLIEEGINVETEASLTINSSISVRRLVAMLSYVNNPKDTLNCYIARTMDVDSFPTGYHDLTGLCDKLFLILKNDAKYGADCQRETVFISAFMDRLHDFAASNGNNLSEFLKWWEEKNEIQAVGKPCISSSLSSDSVKILTVHKSKGLAFPYVIVPFIEDIKLYEPQKTIKWCSPENIDGTALEGLSGKLFRVLLSDKSKDSAFSGEYAKEYLYQSVDAINMMYVATTRAQFGMTVISGKPGEKDQSMAQLMYAYCASSDIENGTPCDFSQSLPGAGNDNDQPKPCPLEYNVFPLGERLGIRPYAEEYFKPQNNEYGSLRPVTRGIVLHDILSRILVPSDLETAVRRSVDDGSLSGSSFQQIVDMLGQAMKSHPEFFPEDASGKLPPGYKVYRETPILCSDGSQIRPDRVVISPEGRVVIVDYKFGTDSTDYTAQIQGYADAFRRMGYSAVETKLWFVFKNYLR